ncbi:multicopper oxidase domain-containing protein [Corynebacterium lizhenjunii]|uniref:multicopper oxidase domain-containing protein n=1 Tax=Corynebacterium lizhenjunii TaxID=2709394 RepID=UPI0013ECD34B|nr:multicopper oxidase domain-containing protein [Corynebacterium lizhenjunii]
MIDLSAPTPEGKPAAAKTPEGAGWGAWALIGLAIAAVIALAVVNTQATNLHSSDHAAGASAPAASGAVTVDVRVEGMAFVPASVDVPVGSQLIVNFTNSGDRVHDLKIGQAETGRVEPGKTVRLDAGVITEDVAGLCTIAGHSVQGMTIAVNAIDVNSIDGAQPSAGHDHTMAAGGDNPFVEVPSAAQRMAARADFEAVDPRLAPAQGRVHEHRWVMTEEVRDVAPGHRQVRWLFDGQAPGPTLRGKVGDTFRITIVNQGTMGHSIDFHAGEVSPDAPMRTIEPGEELVYEFKANRAGIWMYHCATAPMSLHIANGMAGAVVIDPQDLRPVDAEYALVASDIFLGEEAIGADAARVAAGQPDLMAFNYYPNQYDLQPLRARVGQSIRVWLLNVGPDQALSFHVVGEQFDTVYKEGAYLLRGASDTGSQALDLQPAQGGFVEMTFTEPGTYTFVNHIMTSAEKGQHGQIIVSN